MKTKVFYLVIAAALFAGCDDAAKNPEAEKKEATATDDHQHTAPSTAVPETEFPPAGAKVYFKNLAAGQTVSSPYQLQMGVDGMKIDTAGPLVSGSGHHHLMIDGPDSLTKGTVVKKDSVNIHFGKGQTEYELKLSPGRHKLTLQFADGIHRSYGQQLSTTIEVNVKQ